MCGIAAIINHHGCDLELIKQSLLHRGPDEQSVYIDNNLAFIHTRLAIQDVRHGHQPFHYQDYTIVFNGEIYNHLALRQELREFNFLTRSDTETLLYLYIKFKEKMFNKIDGMFAFCIYNKRDQTLVIGRDRAGKKPLYYHKNNNQFILASELNTLRVIANLNVDNNCIDSYIRTGFFYRSHTAYKDVFAFEAGHYYQINIATQHVSKHRYFDILDTYLSSDKYVNFAEASSHLETYLKESINSRLNSNDRSVGVFLSGGIDSNLIVALAAAQGNQLKTFTVKTSHGYDESYLAKLTANQYQTQHTELEMNMNIPNDIEHILSLYGQPFMDSSAVPSYYVSQLAKKNISVVLTGDGADELFAGYKRYVPIAMRLPSYLSYLAHFRHMLPKSHKKQNAFNMLYRLLSMSNKKNLDFYLAATTDIYEDVYTFEQNPVLDEMNNLIIHTFSNSRLTPLSQMLYLDFNLLLFSDLLVKMDIATMANSLEARSPFLSAKLLDFAPRLPDQFKIQKFKTKYILRTLAKKYLPPELVNQPKRGFEVPLSKWVDHELKDHIFDALTEGAYSENFIKRKFINKLLSNKISIHNEKRAKILWNLYCLEVWYKNVSKKGLAYAAIDKGFS